MQLDPFPVGGAVPTDQSVPLVAPVAVVDPAATVS